MVRIRPARRWVYGRRTESCRRSDGAACILHGPVGGAGTSAATDARGIGGRRWTNAVWRSRWEADVYFVTRDGVGARPDGPSIAWSERLDAVKSDELTGCGTQDGSPDYGYPGVGPIDGSCPDRPIGEVLLAVRTATDAITGRTVTVTERIRRVETAGMGNSPENSSSMGVNRAIFTPLSAISNGSGDKRDGCVRHSARYDPPEPPCGRRCGTPSASHRSWHTRRRAILTICCPLAASAPDDQAAMRTLASPSVGSADRVRFA